MRCQSSWLPYVTARQHRCAASIICADSPYKGWTAGSRQEAEHLNATTEPQCAVSKYSRKSMWPRMYCACQRSQARRSWHYFPKQILAMPMRCFAIATPPAPGNATSHA